MKAAMMQKIETANQAIDALGGHNAVAALFADDPRVALNWRKRGLPPNTYAALAPLLASRGLSFSPQLFGQRALAITPGSKRQRRRKNGGGK
jgi:hypothetical protein